MIPFRFWLIYENPDRKGDVVMKMDISEKKQDRTLDIGAIASQIAIFQRPDGEIPWCHDQKTDPWDHVEAAMGLSIGGYWIKALSLIHISEPTRPPVASGMPS